MLKGSGSDGLLAVGTVVGAVVVDAALAALPLGADAGEEVVHALGTLERLVEEEPHLRDDAHLVPDALRQRRPHLRRQLLQVPECRLPLRELAMSRLVVVDLRPAPAGDLPTGEPIVQLWVEEQLLPHRLEPRHRNAVEVGAHMVRHWAGLNGAGRDRQRLDRVRLSRWVLAPVSTARLRRRMILQEIVSYREALAWDGQRRRSKSDLQDRYGRLAWRWQAPRRERLDYRLGDHGSHEPAALPAGPTPSTPARRRPARSTSTSTDRKAAVTSDAELAAAGKRVAARIEHRGGRLTRRALVDGLRNDEGLAVGNDRATALLARLRDDAASSTTTPTTPAPALAARRSTEEVPA